MKLHFLDHAVEDLQRTPSSSFKNAASSEQINVLTTQSFEMKSRLLSKRMQETVHSLKNAWCRVRGAGIDGSRYGAGSPKKQQPPEKGEIVAQDGTRSPPKKVERATDTGEASLSVEKWYGQTGLELFRKFALQSLAECVWEGVLAQGRHVYDIDTRVKFVRAGRVSGGFCPTLSD